MISVVLATYNRPLYLSLSLASVLNQEGAGEYEVLVADDGSGEPTREVVAKASRCTTVPVRHVWHEDLGFRLAAIRNRAVAQARGDWLVFMDDDCLAPPWLLRRYRRLSSEHVILAGDRVNCSESWTRDLLSKKDRIAGWTTADFLRLWRRGVLDRPTRLLVSLPDGPFRSLQRDNWSAVEGCNFGVSRRSYFAVNGFDEGFSGWGYEDWDLAQRLHRHGTKVKDGRFALAVLHLWHPLSDRSSAQANKLRFEGRCRSGLTFAEQGVESHLAMTNS